MSAGNGSSSQNHAGAHSPEGERVSREREVLAEARARGLGATLAAYVKLSGPGWLQSAITLGGGSLAGSLYLGVIGGYDFLWLQPLMMILGVVMLSAIAYVTLSTGQRPFESINTHVSPVLGWGWLIAAMMANLVWAMPQFSLGTVALQQNLFPELLGGNAGKFLCVLGLFLAASFVVWFYDSAGIGMKVFDWVLKAMVGLVVVSFFGVVIAMSLKGILDWGLIFKGFVPNVGLLWHPVADLQPFIEASGNPDYWTQAIIETQRTRMIAAAATAVGINMTFLLPYSMLRKGWDSGFRGLAAFDLSTGLFIPFLLATSCVVIAAASQFHARFDAAEVEKPAVEITGEDLRSNLERRLTADMPGEKAAEKQKAFAALDPEEVNAAIDRFPTADRQLAVMLVKRDSYDLAKSLENLFGEGGLTQRIFGVGVLGMALSTIIILMVINGFCVTEMTQRDGDRVVQRLGAVLPGIVGGLGFLAVWDDKKAQFWLAVPTSNFGMALLPIAYVTFFLMMNNRSLLGEAMPRGVFRLFANVVMLLAIVVSGVGAGMSIYDNLGWGGMAAVGAFIAAIFLASAMHAARRAAM